MEFIYQDIPRIYTALAEWMACIVYLIILKKRFSNIKIILSSAIALIVQTLLLVLTGNLPTVFWIPCMMTATGCMYIFLYCCSNITALNAVYCCARAFLLAEFAASLEWQFYTYLLSQGFDNKLFRFLLLIGIYGVVFGIAWRLERPLLTDEYLSQLSVRELLSAVGIIIFAFAFSNLSFVSTNIPFTNRLKVDIFSTRTLVDLGGIAILYAFQSRICEYMAEKEISYIQSMLKNQYVQYRNNLESMEMIHIKYHDLKHQIEGLRAETDIDKRKDWLDAMERELQTNVLVDKTGNSVLDTILASKILHALKNNIRVTYVADGRLLNFVHVTDICTIFGNALDNAIESVIMLPDSEKRLIHVSVSSQRNFVFIQVTNYCDKELKREAGKMPVTTKSDKKNHGYGLKSIQYSVGKYGGSISVDIKKSWFELSILIPKE